MELEPDTYPEMTAGRGIRFVLVGTAALLLYDGFGADRKLIGGLGWLWAAVGMGIALTLCWLFVLGLKKLTVTLRALEWLPAIWIVFLRWHLELFLKPRSQWIESYLSTYLVLDIVIFVMPFLLALYFKKRREALPSTERPMP